jgi:hypothetical protein
LRAFAGLLARMTESATPSENTSTPTHGCRAARRAWFAGLIATLLAAQFAGGQSGSNAVVQAFDFTRPTDAARWTPTHDLAAFTLTSTGLLARITGADPYMTGPARDYPSGKPLWLHLRLKSDQGGTGQVFYYTNYPTEANSVKFFVPVGDWYEAKVAMPALGGAWQLRIDPPGSGGACLLDRLWFEERTLLQAPTWPKPAVPVIGPDALTLQSSDLELTHDTNALGAFKVAVAGQAMAVGHTQPMIGYLAGSVQRWLNLGNTPTNPANVALVGGSIRVLSRARDPDGALWTIECVFSPTNSGAIVVESRCAADQDRQIVYLPLFTLLPGLGSFGTNKNQGLFCGLEYLENEPSSSQADIIGPQSQRQVPDILTVTIPLMALAAQDRYIGLVWQPDANLSAVFDSPDRLFGSGGHLMGMIFPGSDGQNRVEGSLMPYWPGLVYSNTPVVLRAVIIGGRGQSVAPAVQQYITLCGLPPLPASAPAAVDYFNTAAHGWLDSQIRTNGLFRHAYWPGFSAQPAADACVWMRWLAGRVSDTDLQTRLVSTASLRLPDLARWRLRGG